MLLFKRRQVFKEPLRMLLRAFLGTSRSSTFLGVFVIIYQSEPDYSLLEEPL